MSIPLTSHILWNSFKGLFFGHCDSPFNRCSGWKHLSWSRLSLCDIRTTNWNWSNVYSELLHWALSLLSFWFVTDSEQFNEFIAQQIVTLSTQFECRFRIPKVFLFQQFWQGRISKVSTVTCWSYGRSSVSIPSFSCMNSVDDFIIPRWELSVADPYSKIGH
jgi:hypothetical protein